MLIFILNKMNIYVYMLLLIMILIINIMLNDKNILEIILIFIHLKIMLLKIIILY